MFTIVVIYVSCDPGVNPDQLNTDELISVTCIISPADSVYKAYIFRAMAVGSSIDAGSAFVNDALVTISDGINYDTLHPKEHTDSQTGMISRFYSGSRNYVVVEENQHYFLDIKTPQGQHLTGTTLIPPTPGEPSISGEMLNSDFQFTTSWFNHDMHRYFSILMTATGSYSTNTTNGQTIVDLNPVLADAVKFPSDQQLYFNSYQGRIVNAYLADSPTLTIAVRNVDQDAFFFFDSFSQFEEWNANNSGNLLPNLRAVPLIHSNVNGGVGIFGSYNESKLTFIIE